jgi:GT2 family glycosyltransferase
MSAHPAVFAVVVTYNRKALLVQCLDALQEQTRAVDRIVVVDNASSDGTAAAVRADFPGVDLLVLDENRGGAGGFHVGMKAAAEGRADWIWVMDDDAEPAPDALEALLAPGLHRRPGAVALTPLKRLPSGHLQYDQVGWYDPVRMNLQPISAHHTKALFTEVEYGAFVGLLVSADAVRRVGLPDVSYFIWYDDVEFCLRLQRAGQLYLVPASEIVHHVAGANGEKPWRNRPPSYFWRYYYSIRNRLLIVHRHVPRVDQRLQAILQAGFLVVRKIFSVLCYDEAHRERQVRLLMRAFLDGVTGRTGKRVDPARFQGGD